MSIKNIKVLQLPSKCVGFFFKLVIKRIVFVIQNKRKYLQRTFYLQMYNIKWKILILVSMLEKLASSS